MKEPTWDNPNKMHMESAYKLFNRQTNCITTGNAWCSTQYSCYIRPWNEVKNYSYIGKPGEFLKYDMQFFHDVPNRIREILYDKERTESYILYEFFVWKNGNRDVIGHVLTDYNHNLIDDSIHRSYGQCYYKRVSVIEECEKYICA